MYPNHTRVLPRVQLRTGMGGAYVGEVVQTENRDGHVWIDVFFADSCMMTVDYTTMSQRRQARYVSPSTPLTIRPTE